MGDEAICQWLIDGSSKKTVAIFWNSSENEVAKCLKLQPKRV